MLVAVERTVHMLEKRWNPGSHRRIPLVPAKARILQVSWVPHQQMLALVLSRQVFGGEVLRAPMGLERGGC